MQVNAKQRGICKWYAIVFGQGGYTSIIGHVYIKAHEHHRCTAGLFSGDAANLLLERTVFTLVIWLTILRSPFRPYESYGSFGVLSGLR